MVGTRNNDMDIVQTLNNEIDIVRTLNKEIDIVQTRNTMRSILSEFGTMISILSELVSRRTILMELMYKDMFCCISSVPEGPGLEITSGVVTLFKGRGQQLYCPWNKVTNPYPHCCQSQNNI